MSVLGKLELHKLLAREKIEERLIITPLFNQDKQVNEASIDIRLGNDFIVTRRGNLASLDPARQDVRESRYQTKHYVSFKEPFYLHHKS